MSKTIVVEGRDFQIKNEAQDHYEAVDYAPDGEGTEVIIAKKDCYVDDQGRMHARALDIRGNYK
jgi:hypothetical protein